MIFLCSLIMFAGALNFKRQFSLTAHFLNFESFPKTTMIQNDQKLMASFNKNGPYETQIAKKHADIVIVKQKMTGKLIFYDSLEEEFVTIYENNLGEDVQQFFQNRDLEDFDIILTYFFVVAREKSTQLVDIFYYEGWVFYGADFQHCVPFSISEIAKLQLRDIFNEQSDQALDWEKGEFAVTFSLWKIPKIRIAYFAPPRHFVFYEIANFQEENASMIRVECDQNVGWYGNGQNFGIKQYIKFVLRRSLNPFEIIPYNNLAMISLDIAKVLIESKCDLNFDAKEMCWPQSFIHNAFCYEYAKSAKVVELLLQAGADINAKTFYGGKTALMLAVKKLMPVEFVKLLVEKYHADLFAKDNYDQTAMFLLVTGSFAGLTVERLEKLFEYLSEAIDKKLKWFAFKIWFKFKFPKFCVVKKTQI